MKGKEMMTKKVRDLVCFIAAIIVCAVFVMPVVIAVFEASGVFEFMTKVHHFALNLLVGGG